jgi:hypothetical protein
VILLQSPKKRLRGFAAVSANIANEANETAAHGIQIENEILQLREENAELNDADIKLSAQYDRDQLYCERLFDELVKFREQASLGIQANLLQNSSDTMKTQFAVENVNKIAYLLENDFLSPLKAYKYIYIYALLHVIID